MPRAAKLHSENSNVDEAIDAKLVLEEYVNGNLDLVESLRLILEATRLQAGSKTPRELERALNYVMNWSYELTFAADLKKLITSKKCMVLLQESTRKQ